MGPGVDGSCHQAVFVPSRKPYEDPVTDEDDGEDVGEDIVNNEEPADEEDLKKKIVTAIEQEVKVAGMIKKVLKTSESDSFAKNLRRLKHQLSLMHGSVFENMTKMIELKEREQNASKEGDERAGAKRKAPAAAAAGPSHA
jgi:hypothetical protein